MLNKCGLYYTSAHDGTGSLGGAFTTGAGFCTGRNCTLTHSASLGLGRAFCVGAGGFFGSTGQWTSVWVLGGSLMVSVGGSKASWVVS